MNEKYKKFVDIKRKIADINNIIALSHWDLEVYLPEQSWDNRWNQIQTLSWISYDLSTSKKLWILLNELSKDETLSEDEKINVLLAKEDYVKTIRFPKKFVLELSKLQNESFVAWQKAKQTNDFKTFKPFLEKLLKLKRKEAKILWFWNNLKFKNIYDALLNEFEPWITTEKLDVIFNDVKTKLVPFIQNVIKNQNIDDSVMNAKFGSEDKKFEFSKILASEIWFDFSKGRLDKSTHPFTTSFWPEDVRLTTRTSELWIINTLLSTVHEAGHWIYEQNLPTEQYGLPLGSAVSYWIHESQSIIWERYIWKSLNYWKRVFDNMKDYFPEESMLKDMNYFDFYKALNKIEPSFIRTEADELTYHIHILIRYEIEKDLLNWNLKVKDIPKAWNKKHKDYLGIKVDNDSIWCLQDVHWSHWSFWYFPSYSLWSFYAAQFFDKARKDIKDFDEKVEKWEFWDFKNWLNSNIHSFWRKYEPEILCEKITGEKLNFDYFMDYVNKKYPI